MLYYFLLDWQRWAHGIRAMVRRAAYVATYQRIWAMDKVLGEFLRGQLMVMLIMGLIYGFGLMFVGLDSGLCHRHDCRHFGVCALFGGAFTGLLLATLAALLQFGSWQGLLLWCGAYLPSANFWKAFSSPRKSWATASACRLFG